MDNERLEEFFQSETLPSSIEELSGTIRYSDRGNRVKTYNVASYPYIRYGQGENDIPYPARVLRELIETGRIASPREMKILAHAIQKQAIIDQVTYSAVPGGDIFRKLGLEAVDNVLVAVSPNVPIEMTAAGNANPNVLHAYVDKSFERVWFNTHAAQINMNRMDADADRVQLIIDKKRKVAWVIKHPQLRTGQMVNLHFIGEDDWQPIGKLRDINITKAAWGETGNLSGTILSRLETPPIGPAYNRGVAKNLRDRVDRERLWGAGRGTPEDLRRMGKPALRKIEDSSGNMIASSDYYANLKYRYRRILLKAHPQLANHQETIDQLMYYSMVRKGTEMFEALESEGLIQMRKGKVGTTLHPLLKSTTGFNDILSIFTNKRQRITELDDSVIQSLTEIMYNEPERFIEAMKQIRLGTGLDKSMFKDIKPYSKRRVRSVHRQGIDVGEKGLFSRLKSSGLLEMHDIWRDESALPEALRGVLDPGLPSMSAVRFRVKGRLVDFEKGPDKYTPVIGTNIKYEKGKFRYMSQSEVMDELFRDLDLRIYRESRRFAEARGSFSRANLLAPWGKRNLEKMSEVLGEPVEYLRSMIQRDQGGTALQKLVAEFDWLNPENSRLVSKITGAVRNIEGRYGAKVRLEAQNIIPGMKDLFAEQGIEGDISEFARKVLTSRVFGHLGTPMDTKRAERIIQRGAAKMSFSEVPGKFYDDEHFTTAYVHGPDSKNITLVEPHLRIGDWEEMDGQARFIMNPKRQTKALSMLQNSIEIKGLNRVIIDMEGVDGGDLGAESFRFLTPEGKEAFKTALRQVDRETSPVKTDKFDVPYERWNERGELETYYTTQFGEGDPWGKWITPEGTKIMDSNVAQARIRNSNTVVHMVETMAEMRKKGMETAVIQQAMASAGLDPTDASLFNRVVAGEFDDRIYTMVDVLKKGSTTPVKVRALLTQNITQMLVPDIGTNMLSDMHGELRTTSDSIGTVFASIAKYQLETDPEDFLTENVLSAVRSHVDTQAKLAMGNTQKALGLAKGLLSLWLK